MQLGGALGHCSSAWPQQTPANISQATAGALLRSLLRLSPPLLDGEQQHLPVLPLVPWELLLAAKPPPFRADSPSMRTDRQTRVMLGKEDLSL